MLNKQEGRHESTCRHLRCVYRGNNGIYHDLCQKVIGSRGDGIDDGVNTLSKESFQLRKNR